SYQAVTSRRTCYSPALQIATPTNDVMPEAPPGGQNKEKKKAIKKEEK
ncbi:uncharacterized, partial [Tachysurus ichikawai]